MQSNSGGKMRIENRLIIGSLFAASAITCLFFASNARAGAPLKGIDVTLGKDPGGDCLARTTDAGGKADFGIWPKGNYTLDFGPASSKTAPGQIASRKASPGKLQVYISGTSTGKLERDLNAGQSSGRTVPVSFSLDGKQRLVVVVNGAD
jgi:hypothetical protein